MGKGILPSANHENPDGSLVRDITIFAGSRGSIQLKCKFDFELSTMQYLIQDAEHKLGEEIKAITKKPSLPQMPPQAPSTPTEDGAIPIDNGFVKLLKILNEYGKLEERYVKEAKPLEQLFETVIKPYLDQNNIKLQDQIDATGHHTPAVILIDKPVVDHDKLSRKQRIEQDMIASEHIRTFRYYEDGQPSNFNYISHISTQEIQHIAVPPKLPNDRPPVVKTIIATQKEVDGNFVDLTPEELSLYRATAFQKSRDEIMLPKPPGLDMPAADLGIDMTKPFRIRRDF